MKLFRTNFMLPLSLTAYRQLNELFVQLDNVACQFYNAIHDSLNCLNDASSSEAKIHLHACPITRVSKSRDIISTAHPKVITV